MIKDNFPVVGYLKFIDDKYIDDYICLKKLHLASISNFNKSSKDGDLINDSDEGVVYKYKIPNLSFITCFTEIRTCNLNENGILNTVFLNNVLSHDEKRPFIIVYKDKLICLNKQLDNINISNNRCLNSISKGKEKKLSVKQMNPLYDMEEKSISKSKNPFLHGTSVFTRKIDYSGKPFNKPFDFSLEEQGELGFATKDHKYEVQQEYRIGVVLPNAFYKQYKSKKGIDIDLDSEINNFGTKYDFDDLHKIKFNKDSQGIWKVESL